MYNGFYEMQQSFTGNTRGFMEALDNIEAELPLTPVSIGSFLQGGFHGHLALRLADTHGLDVCAMHDGEDLLHVFNTFRSPSGQLCYLDARGVTDDPDLFLAPFEGDVSMLSGPYTRKETEQLIRDSSWAAFEEDAISNSMVDWILAAYPDNFAPALQCKEVKPSLVDKIKEAQNKQEASHAADSGKVHAAVALGR